MCNAYNLRHRNKAILDIARAMQLAVADLPEFPPRHRIGIKQRGLILLLAGNGGLARSWARWSLIPRPEPGRRRRASCRPRTPPSPRRPSSPAWSSCQSQHRRPPRQAWLPRPPCRFSPDTEPARDVAAIGACLGDSHHRAGVRSYRAEGTENDGQAHDLHHRGRCGRRVAIRGLWARMVRRLGATAGAQPRQPRQHRQQRPLRRRPPRPPGPSRSAQ